MKFNILVILSLILSLINSKLRISKLNRQFFDEQGRTRIFHGVNVVYKVPPYFPQQDGFDPFLSLSTEDISYMKQFGFNLVRLGVLWEAIETSPNQYNYDLLDKIMRMINLLGDNGIYTIVDAHQDVFSRILCGEGVPYFYAKELEYEKDCQSSYFKKFMHLISVCKGIKEYNFREDENGKPYLEDCLKGNFMWYHTSPDLTSIYSKFYKNEKGILDKFVVFWQILATKFKSSQFVLGYDLWNEPWVGDFYNNLKNLIPGRSDNEDILPMYRKIDKGIREIDDDYIMMFEPTPFPDILPFFGGIIAGGFNEAPLPSQYNDRQVLNMHSYCCQVSGTMCNTGEPPLKSSETCRKHHFSKLKFMNDFGKKFNMSTILTEFGACKNTEACFHEISNVADAADEYMISWTYWMYKPYKDFTTTCTDNAEGLFNSDGSIQDWKVKALTRTYVQAFQGVPLNQKFDINTKVFQALYTANYSINYPSELYFNRNLHYKNGFKFFLNSTENIEIDNSTENVIKFKLNINNTQDIENVNKLVILSPQIQIKVSLSNSSQFLSQEKLTYLEDLDEIFSFNILDLLANAEEKNSILIKERNNSKNVQIKSSSYYLNEEEYILKLNKNEIFSFTDKNHYTISMVLLKIKIGSISYRIEIRNMLKHHIVVNIK